MTSEPAFELITAENKAVVVYPNRLGTVTVLALTDDEFQAIKPTLSAITDMRCVDIRSGQTVDYGISTVFDKLHERNQYSGWRLRMKALGIDPDAPAPA